MSVADKINTLISNINSAYSAISAKGGTIPAHKNTQNIASAIDSIPFYAPKTLAYISYGDATTAQPFVDLMAAQPNSPLGGVSYAFAETSGLTSIDLSALDFSAVTDTICMFNNATDLTNITWANSVDFGNVETMEGMYRGTTSLTSVDLSKFATGEYLESVFNMFASSGVQSVDLGAPFDTSAVTDFYGMFNSCTALTDLYHLNNLRMDSAANVGAMFYNCSAMTELNLGEGNRSDSKNLFDKDNANTVNGYFTTGTTTITASSIIETIVYIACSPNTTYTVQKTAGTVFTIGTTNTTPAAGVQVYNVVGDNTGSSLTLTTGSDSQYLVVRAYRSSSDTITEEQMLNSIQIELGSTATPYEPYAFTPPELSLSVANADYMLAGMMSLQSLDLSGWKSGSDDLANSNFWTTQPALTTLTLNGPKRLVSGKLADSLVATFNSKQGSTITTLKLNDPEFFTTDGTTPTLTDLSDIWGGNALTTVSMTGWDLSGVVPTTNPSSPAFTSLSNLTTMTIGDFVLPSQGLNLTHLIGVNNDGSQGYSSAAPLLANLHLVGSTVLNIYNGGTGEHKSENAFAGTPIADGTGHIYVPSSLVNAYKADSFWSAYASIITAEA